MTHWAKQTIIKEATVDYNLDPSSEFRVIARNFSGDMVEL